MVFSSCGNPETDTTSDASTPDTANSADSNNTDASLDLLTNYDRNMWPGPDGWSPEQWHWKRILRWDHECDYLADISLFDLTGSNQLVQVQCVPGAYQGLSYFYIYNKKQNTSAPVMFPDNSVARASADKPFAVWGIIEFNSKQHHLKILHLSRGTGDCGTLEVYDFNRTPQKPVLIEMRQKTCSETALPDNPSPDLFNPEKWPLVKLQNN